MVKKCDGCILITFMFKCCQCECTVENIFSSSVRKNKSNVE